MKIWGPFCPPDTVTKQTARLRLLIVSPKGERRTRHTLAKINVFSLRPHHHILSTLLLCHFKGVWNWAGAMNLRVEVSGKWLQIERPSQDFEYSRQFSLWSRARTRREWEEQMELGVGRWSLTDDLSPQLLSSYFHSNTHARTHARDTHETRTHAHTHR